MKLELETLCTDRLAAVSGGSKKKQAGKPRSPRNVSRRGVCDGKTVLDDPLWGAVMEDCS